jgi:hypothetical protein
MQFQFIQLLQTQERSNDIVESLLIPDALPLAVESQYQFEVLLIQTCQATCPL